ncbi:MAG TPA: DegT/DnrJ/EryC1/StrS family aminotransferase [Gaiellaceae bacterium]|jgi:dTDP-4-amino-4,6-dideoxygalactose transaminase|nr:DegT/DnrJ/EryC1/StrS family aminotransferase [Gaiellaceae bacterium]
MVETPASVPFLDLAPSTEAVRATVVAGLERLLRSGAFVNGPAVADFEKAYARWCGTGDCVGTASGLDALRLALLAAELQPGEEVIVPALTFVATLEAVTQAGGRPVPADVREDDFCLDAAAAAAAVGERTRFLLPVHLYGQVADVAALESIGPPIVEDACQAHGAVREGRRAGTVGIAAAFSFYPGKNLGAFGDAGGLVTSSDEVARRARALREHGQTRKYVHAAEGYTARLDTFQALVLLAKLPLLDPWNTQRAEAARLYNSLLDGVGDLVLPTPAAGSSPVWHLYVIRTANPDALAESLARRGIGTRRHYPDPVHLTEAYTRLGYGRGSFPVAERLAQEVLSLPIFPGIRDDQLEAVARAVREYFDRG